MPARRRRRRRATPPQLPFLRRRSTMWLFAAIVTLAIGVILGVVSVATGGDGDSEPSGPPPTLSAELPAIAPDETLLELAFVTGIVDGDTIDVEIDGREERVRYYGVDTPERGDDCFGDATGRNESLAGDTVLLLPDARERDRFDRLLRYVFTEDGESIDAQLIADGLGVAWRQDGAYRDELIELENEVREAGAGCLWE